MYLRGRQGQGSGRRRFKVDQSQQASNSNDTSQNAESNATTEQKNINKPPRGDEPQGSNGGPPVWSGNEAAGAGREQSNLAETLSLSQNNNETAQGNFQNQEAFRSDP